jgi:hypothetical protein
LMVVNWGWFDHLWWSVAESCHLLRHNKPSGRNKCVSSCTYVIHLAHTLWNWRLSCTTE